MRYFRTHSRYINTLRATLNYDMGEITPFWCGLMHGRIMEQCEMAERIIEEAVATARILIVDSDTTGSARLARQLVENGYGVDVTREAGQAASQIQTHAYDLVLIDIMMPGMNGTETLRQIKVANPLAIAAIMSGRSQLEEMVAESVWQGADDVLYKPFEPTVIAEVLERCGAGQIDLPVIDLPKYEIDPDALKLVPEAMARKYTLLPLRVEESSLFVAMADPTNLYAIEDLRVRTSLNIKPLRALRADIMTAFAELFQQSGEIERQIEKITPILSQLESSASEKISAEVVSQTPIARAIELMVRQAVRDQASDIHLEPQETHLRVRYRIDGVLHEAMTLPKRVHAPLVSRIKVLSNLNIAERRRPQDGQFSVEESGRAIDIRVATINTVHGEMVVMRVLDKAVSVRPLDAIGFSPGMLESYYRIIHAPWGIMLCAGPTGSGKTSTLYASINQLDRREKKIITIEDPVEYRFSGISQVQVSRRAGVTFASGLRSAMRLDPDVILVGEIRDQETAATAIQASLTGHLVFSTIHANDSVGAILRLADLGVEPFLVTSSLLAVVSQRLVRRVCKHCMEPQPASQAERMAYESATGEDSPEFHYGSGCDECAETGYRGRIPVFEMLEMGDEMRRLMLQGASSDDMRRAAQEMGMKTMLQDGMLKVKQRLTTPAEILKNVFALSHRQGEA